MSILINYSISLIKKRANILVIIFFAMIFSFGLFIYDDYGMSWDEPTERQILHANINQFYKTLLPDKWEKDYSKNPDFFNSIPDINTYKERDHGQAPYYPMGILDFIKKWNSDTKYYDHNSVIKLEPNIKIPDVVEQYQMRHLYNYILCFIGVIFLYFTLKLITKRRIYGIISVILYITSPRFFADSFFNNKDLITLSMMLIVIYFATSFVFKRKLTTAIALALFSAITLNIRISIGVFLIIALITCIITYIFSKEKANLFNWITLIIAIVLCFVFYCLLTPSTWNNPITHIFYVVYSSVQFRWNYPFIYEGYVTMNDPLDSGFRELPSSYLVKMIIITTPIFILVSFVIGYIGVWIKSFKSLLKKNIDRQNGFLLAIIIFMTISIILPIVLDSILYNSWRHLYYLYGSILIIATIGIKLIWENLNMIKNNNINKIKYILPVVFTIHIAVSTSWNVINHPYQYTYYNILAGDKPFDLYEADYWNVSARQCLEKALKSNKGNITITGFDYHGTDALVKGAAMLEDSYRKRIVLGGTNTEYVLINLSYYQTYNPKDGIKIPTIDEVKLSFKNKKIYSVDVNGQPIMMVVQR